MMKTIPGAPVQLLLRRAGVSIWTLRSIYLDTSEDDAN